MNAQKLFVWYVRFIERSEHALPQQVLSLIAAIVVFEGDQGIKVNGPQRLSVSEMLLIQPETAWSRKSSRHLAQQRLIPDLCQDAGASPDFISWERQRGGNLPVPCNWRAVGCGMCFFVFFGGCSYKNIPDQTLQRAAGTDH